MLFDTSSNTASDCRLMPFSHSTRNRGNFFFMAPQPLMGQGPPPPIVEASLSHSDAPHSVGLLWTSDRPAKETSTCQHTILTTDRNPCPRRDSNPQSQQASGRITHALDRAATGTGNTGEYKLPYLFRFFRVVSG